MRRILDNRGPPGSEMEDDQRKAMFARMHGGGGGGGGGGATTGGGGGVGSGGGSARGAACWGTAAHSSACTAGWSVLVFQCTPQVRATMSSTCASTASAIARRRAGGVGGASSSRSSWACIPGQPPCLTDRPTRWTPAFCSASMAFMTVS